MGKDFFLVGFDHCLVVEYVAIYKAPILDLVSGAGVAWNSEVSVYISQADGELAEPASDREHLMPLIIDYTVVLQRLESEGLRCNYPNGGSFGFAPGAGPQVRGWIGPADPTIRPAMQSMIRHFCIPQEFYLA